MTSYDTSRVNGLYYTPTDKDKMRELRRPTLCVIDENSCEIPIDFSSETPRIQYDLDQVSCDNLAPRDHNDNVTHSSADVLLPDTDLTELKATTARLKLSTRRKSTVAWQQEHLSPVNTIEKPDFSINTLDNGDEKDDGFTEERKNRINEALAWIRSELQEMRSQDELLARKLLSIRQDIHKLKLQKSCEEHQDMLEDVAMDMEESNILSVISDMPIRHSVSDSPLKQLGVTRMNMSARRFSTC